MATLDDLVFPEKEDFEQKDPKELMDLWRHNHLVLFEYIMSNDIPYFGLHGTNAKNLAGILKTKKGDNINIATFYDKEQTNRRLFQLYDMCLYTTSYVRKNNGTAGGIMVFNLEREGENLTNPWEHLYPGSRLSFNFSFDSPAESKLFKSLDDRNNLLWRSDIDLEPQSFTALYRGTIPIDKIEDKYSSDLECKSPYNRLSMSIMRERFLAQDILTQALQILRNYEK